MEILEIFLKLQELELAQFIITFAQQHHSQDQVHYLKYEEMQT